MTLLNTRASNVSTPTLPKTEEPQFSTALINFTTAQNVQETEQSIESNMEHL
jgi:hypothetical protein